MQERLTTQEAYKKCVDTFTSWVNWQKETDLAGLMLGLGDYYAEIRLIEDELGIPQEDRFKLSSVLDRSIWC